MIKKNTKVSRSRPVLMRLTDSEYTVLAEAAARVSLPLATYVRVAIRHKLGFQDA